MTRTIALARRQAVTVTINAGQSLSSSVDAGGQTAVGIVVPSNWTPAAVTFQASLDGTNFVDLSRRRSAR
jgi:hypothetical protein